MSSEVEVISLQLAQVFPFFRHIATKIFKKIFLVGFLRDFFVLFVSQNFAGFQIYTILLPDNELWYLTHLNLKLIPIKTNSNLWCKLRL